MLNRKLVENETVIFWGVLFLVLCVATPAFAAGSGMAWETALDKIADSLQGPIARAVGIIAIIITALSFVFGEGGGMFKKGLSVAIGLSVAFTASSYLNLFGYAGGAAF